jgi:phospholipase C
MKVRRVSMHSVARWFAPLQAVVLAMMIPDASMALGDLHRVKHVIIVMQENHSFDNYFGALAYAPGSPYHQPRRARGGRRPGGCPRADHTCVDGLSCSVDAGGNFACSNSNVDDDGSIVHAFHDSRRCVFPDLAHTWPSTHREMNFNNPNHALLHAFRDGFVRINDLSEQPDLLGESPTEDQTMAFYNQDQIPFYYELAQKFAISDRYFSSLLGPTVPNRLYLMAATSFGHLTTSDLIPPPGGYRPITGTIFDLMDAHSVTWANYFQDVPQGAAFRPFPFALYPGVPLDPHFLPLPVFLAQAAGAPVLPPLPQVSFVDPNFGFGGLVVENDEHPPTDIQRGQAFVSQVVNAIRDGPFWQDSIIFITYDEHGGFYDHARPPAAPQGGALNPDGINPGQCEDLSNPPASEQPGGGAECSYNFANTNDSSVKNAEALCPQLAVNPTGPYPAECANFNQLGVRVPFIAVSPFSKPHYVSHVVSDHTSLLAFIETAFMADDDSTGTERPHLTLRDLHASMPEDMFDFNRAPSLRTTIGQAAPPPVDCTP